MASSGRAGEEHRKRRPYLRKQQQMTNALEAKIFVGLKCIYPKIPVLLKNSVV